MSLATKPVIALTAVLAMVDVASAADAGAPRTSSWSTSVVIEVPFPRPEASRGMATGALPVPPRPSGMARTEEGLASFYWQSQKTASGELFDKMAMTAAHKTLPFNTRVRVTNVSNGQSVVVRINDRGPFKPGRIIDLSWAAADAIDMRNRGITKVKVEVLE